MNYEWSHFPHSYHFAVFTLFFPIACVISFSSENPSQTNIHNNNSIISFLILMILCSRKKGWSCDISVRFAFLCVVNNVMMAMAMKMMMGLCLHGTRQYCIQLSQFHFEQISWKAKTTACGEWTNLYVFETNGVLTLSPLERKARLFGCWHNTRTKNIIVM